MTQDSGSAVAVQPAEWHGLFSRVGCELRTLADAVNDLQQFLTPLLSDVVVREPKAIMRLQDLDFLEQSLHSLSDLMSSLDASTTLTDVNAVSYSVQALRLADLAKRLSSPLSHRVEPAVDASALELF